MLIVKILTVFFSYSLIMSISIVPGLNLRAPEFNLSLEHLIFSVLSNAMSIRILL